MSLVYSCSGGGDGPDGGSNEAPSQPTQVYPDNNTLCLENTIDFQWNPSVDAENQVITYKLQVSENNLFSTIAEERTTTSTSTIITLEKGKSFYWRVKAIDSENTESSFSSIYQFLTEGNGVSNHLPFSPELISPAFNSLVNDLTTTLSWSASDVDNDNLTFDVYLDTFNPPSTKVSENQTATTYDANLSSATKYFWKIVVKDEHGAQSLGQTWNFRVN
ncbi:hypothetical protein [Aestuariibaculum suncheonense]|uniref:hypothetical protein n=1 Tax=Aestuariibaculum suncheonense TaxID=1028745 RepID=UPI0031ED1029